MLRAPMGNLCPVVRELHARDPSVGQQSNRFPPVAGRGMIGGMSDNHDDHRLSLRKDACLLLGIAIAAATFAVEFSGRFGSNSMAMAAMFSIYAAALIWFIIRWINHRDCPMRPDSTNDRADAP